MTCHWHFSVSLSTVLRPLLLAILLSSSAQAQDTIAPTDADLATLRETLALPEQKIDLAKVALQIDHMIDPNIDVASNLTRLNEMATQVASWLPANASSDDKVMALRTYLYQPGQWNGNRAFKYDLDDPYGHNIQNKLLPTYLTTRSGNCVSMPLLFIILGQKLGIDVTAATAPEHILVKYRRENGQILNLEATDGAGVTQDASYERQLPMTRDALSNGIYLQPLSKKETVAVMMTTLMEYYGQQGLQEQRIAIADLALQYYPKDVAAMLNESSAYYRLMKQRFMDKYQNPNDIPQAERAAFNALARGTLLWRGQAEKLGWREPSASANADYLHTVNQAKTAKQQTN